MQGHTTHIVRSKSYDPKAYPRRDAHSQLVMQQHGTCCAHEIGMKRAQCFLACAVWYCRSGHALGMLMTRQSKMRCCHPSKGCQYITLVFIAVMCKPNGWTPCRA